MNKQLLVALVALFVAAGTLYFAQNDQQVDYNAWKAQFGHKWFAEEDVFRKAIFMKNLEVIRKHNADNGQTYKMGINQFTAFTDEEFKIIFLSPRDYSDEAILTEQTFTPMNQDIDWTTKGAVSKVKNQGNCGSCWAFSAVATLEAFSLMKGTSVDLSEQQLVDCSGKYGNEGCNGGFNYKGLAYVKDSGIASTSQYPYTAKNQACKITGGSFKITNVQNVKGCANLQNAIISRPLGVSVDATNWSKYASGVFNNCKTSLDHDVLLVGVVGDNWKIKNSWGTSWGENGFIRLASGNTCGICIDISPWPV